MDMLRQCATLSTAVAKRLQDSVVYFDDGAAEAAMASFGAKLQQGWDPFRMLQVSERLATHTRYGHCLHVQLHLLVVFEHGCSVDKVTQSSSSTQNIK